ncbi:SDR family oxidoreductase [Acidiphilium sp. AL]|uniref:SDR family NAD(P)-dependent oxidoreductase n=1 Tax=Acidiphilium sp. AL TaxID=2871704 RepID=UPI0021CB8DE5|nr:SDR family oxidoreductase [Acidiphilium sp. AL]MCU4160393.1 SDR family oxidoreductase [Acidiphilium sp. AL]
MADDQDPLFSVAGLAVLVAGGAGGLGLPISRELCRRAARVVIADIDEGKAAACARTLADAGGWAAGIGIDVVATESCAAAIRQVEERCGGIDGLVNASGIYRVASALELADADWERSIDINLTGAFRLARAAGASMVRRERGSIVTITSVSSRVANRNYAAYAASKAGAAHVTRVLATEWAEAGVRVNALGPAVTPTPLAAEIVSDPATREAALARIPMRRFGTPEDLLATIVFLLAPGSRFVTGQVLYVDGGRTIS